MDHTIHSIARGENDVIKRHLRRSRMDFLDGGLPFGDNDDKSLDAETGDHGTKRAQDRLVSNIQQMMREKERDEFEYPHLETDVVLQGDTGECINPNTVDFASLESDEAQALLHRIEHEPLL
jgi:hypothetical protein